MFRPSLSGVIFFSSFAFVAPLCADTLSVSISGQFGAGVTADALAAPNATWAISFDVDSAPLAFNTDTFSFDAPFTDFSYLLNGAPVATAPDSIRFFDSADGGLFALFFGPETGFSNGMPIPEFSFTGDAVFSGAPDSPAIIPGSYPVADALYTDALSFDDEGAGGNVTVVTSQSTVPEPSMLPLFVAMGLFLLVIRPSKNDRARSAHGTTRENLL